MAEGSTTAGGGSWVVIVNSKLQKEELCKVLQTQHKVRVSDSTLEASCIFPASGVAFLVLYMTEVTPGTEITPGGEGDGSCSFPQHIITRLERFHGGHRRAFVVCIAPMFGPRDMSAFCELQNRFTFTLLHFLPAHNELECVQVMNTIAKTHTKPMSDVLKARLQTVRHSVIKSDATRDAIFEQLPLPVHERQILQDTLGSMETVSKATEEDFLDRTSLDRDSIQAVRAFFKS